MSRSRHFHGPVALGAAAALLALAGCPHSAIRSNAARANTLRDVVASTVRARAIEPDGPITARVVNRDEVRAVLSETFDEWKTPAELADYQRALNALGLWPADRDLYAEALAVYGEAVVGLYVPSSRELLLVYDADDPRVLWDDSPMDFASAFALSHELVHLLQHQAYPELMDPDWLPNDSDDLEAAIQAALEGDAMHFGFEAVALHAPAPEKWAPMVEGEFPEIGSDALAEAPGLLRLTFDFPYTGGYTLAWREGARLLESPPISTEQVLHEDRRREPFLLMDLTEIEARLPTGCRTLQRNDVGELQISALFRDLSDDPDPAIWTGWNGDRYLVADCGGRAEWVWWTAWDSPEDAAEFADAYRALAPRVAERARSRTPVVARSGATFVVVASRGLAEEASKSPPPATRVDDLKPLRAMLESQRPHAAPE